MEDSVLRAMARWPDVKAVFGWLRLDRRGRWLLRGRPVDLPNSTAFINANYACDTQGRWFFQNGPQRVFVSLDATPFVYHFKDDGLVAHTGAAAALQEVLLDEDGFLIMVADLGPGLLADGDLAQAFEHFRDGTGNPISPDHLAALLDTPAPEGLFFCWRHRLLPVTAIDSGAVPSRFGFQTEPAEAENGDN